MPLKFLNSAPSWNRTMIGRIKTCSDDHYTKRALCTHGGTRTRNLRIRSPTRYPLRHAGSAYKENRTLDHHLTRVVLYH